MTPQAATGLTVTCLCAEWCGTCRDYKAVFDAAVAASSAMWVSRWIDIEDEADLVGNVDVDNFPTLLISRGDELLFFGTVTPQPSTLSRLLQAVAHGNGQLGSALATPDLKSLLTRLRQRDASA
jgi:thioredoxin-like negative regulator of GroEL